MTSRIRNRTVPFAVAGVLILVLSACGGSSKKDASVNTSTVNNASTATSASTTPSVSASSAASPTDGASSGTASASSSVSLPSTPRLKAINIQPGELPSTWAAGAPSTESPESSTENAALAKCLGVAGIDTGKVAEAFSPDYTLDDSTISSSASTVSSQADVQAGVDLLKNPKLATCYQTLLKAFVTDSGLPSGSTLGKITIEVTPGPNGGPDNVAGVLEGRIPLIVNSATTTLYESVVFITGRLTKVEIDASGVGNPVDSTLIKQVTAKVAARAAQG